MSKKKVRLWLGVSERIMKLGWVGLIVPDENNINTSLANSKNKINSVSANGNKIVLDRHCMSKLYD